MARTETVQNVRDRYAAIAGLEGADIIADDALNFLEYINRNYRKAWARAEWTFATKRLADTLDSNLFADLSSNTEISEVLRVYDANPYISTTAQLMAHIPVRDDVDDGVYVPQGTAGTALTISTLVSTGTAATCTTSAAHNLATGDSVEIAGADQSDYNGIFVVTVTSTTIFTYTLAADPVDTATGTMTATKATVFLFVRIREATLTALSDTVPFELTDFLAQACFADFLRAEGQTGKAGHEDKVADRILLDEIDRVERQQLHQPPTIIGARISGAR